MKVELPILYKISNFSSLRTKKSNRTQKNSIMSNINKCLIFYKIIEIFIEFNIYIICDFEQTLKKVEFGSSKGRLEVLLIVRAMIDPMQKIIVPQLFFSSFDCKSA